MVPVPGPHAGLALHEVGDHLKLLGVNIAVTVQVKHLESDFEMTPRGAQNSQQEDVVRERNEATWKEKESQNIKTSIEFGIVGHKVFFCDILPAPNW